MAYPLADGTSIGSHPFPPTQKRTLHRIFLILPADLPRRAGRPHGLAVDLGSRGVFRCGGIFRAGRNPSGLCRQPSCLALRFHDRLYRRSLRYNRAVALVPLPPPRHVRSKPDVDGWTLRDGRGQKLIARPGCPERAGEVTYYKRRLATGCLVFFFLLPFLFLFF